MDEDQIDACVTEMLADGEAKALLALLTIAEKIDPECGEAVRETLLDHASLADTAKNAVLQFGGMDGGADDLDPFEALAAFLNTSMDTNKALFVLAKSAKP